MKKKYLALLLSCMVIAPCFLTSCGKLADEVAVEEDDEDDDEDEDDEDDEDDEGSSGETEAEEAEPAQSVIVQEIDDETLYAQMEVFVNNRDDILFPNTDDYAHTTCMVCDLDLNGRCELILTGARWYGAEHESRIYEITEDGSGIYEPCFGAVGIDAKDLSGIDFADFGYVRGYYDKEEGRCHYLIRDSFSDDASHIYGSSYVDFSLNDGTIEADIYGKYTYEYVDSQYIYTYIGPNEEFDTEDEFNEYLDAYLEGRVVKRFDFGIYEGNYYFPVSDGDIETMESDKLIEVFADSYKVFAGLMDDREYLEVHSLHSNPYDDPAELLKDSVGSWGLYLTDTEGSITYYEPEDEFYMLLDVYEDGTMNLLEYMNTDNEKEIVVALEEYQTGMLQGVYVPDPKDGMYYDSLELVISEINTDGMLVISTSSMHGDEYLGGSTWYFVKID